MDKFARDGRALLLTATVIMGALLASAYGDDNGTATATSRSKAPKAKAGATFTDKRDGRKYRIVTIGGKTWMAENLNYRTDGSRCYNDDNSKCNQYGRLYDWNAAMKACPAGWHLSSRDDWKDLIVNTDDREAAVEKLKSSGGWGEDGNGTDDYGFSALPGGYGLPASLSGSSMTQREFFWSGSRGYWWDDRTYDWCLYDDNDVNSNELSEEYMLSVRCVMDMGRK
jgi:uncharacterized protein (TIGR02145 family)